MITSAEDFCENCKKTSYNRIMSLFRDKIMMNDRPMVVLSNSDSTGASWYVLHFTPRSLLSWLLLRKVNAVQFNVRSEGRTFSCVPLQLKPREAKRTRKKLRFCFSSFFVLSWIRWINLFTPAPLLSLLWAWNSISDDISTSLPVGRSFIFELWLSKLLLRNYCFTLNLPR